MQHSSCVPCIVNVNLYTASVHVDTQDILFWVNPQPALPLSPNLTCQPVLNGSACIGKGNECQVLNEVVSTGKSEQLLKIKYIISWIL